ncbi:MAG: tRNA pseudouridine(55) synthase TruB [Candidatus Omnitrophota bacterium]|nr:tRNA pseudouridine(55) synthase TruB [Candidatus Omnitrophota bacterium]
MDGILVVNKPSGLTSHDVVDFIKKKFRMKKVGHAGTLDPLATGILVILLNKSTKLSNKIMDDSKEYEVTLQLGVSTDSGDADGKIISKSDKFNIKQEKFQDVIKNFLGDIEQIPPMVSALKYKGKRLYQLARKGIEVPRKPRWIHIFKIEIVKFAPPFVNLRVLCSKGTYIRTLCSEIGRFLGCGAYAAKMCRTRSGNYRIEDSLTLDELGKMSDEDLREKIVTL